MAEPKTEEKPQPQYAFIVQMTADNRVEFIVKVGGIEMEREADANDVRRACLEVVSGLDALQIASETVNLQMMQMRRMQAQAQAAAAAKSGLIIPK